MDKVKAILGSATALFATKGYERTSVAEVAEDAGVASGTVIYHFKSKENLLHVIAWNTLSAMHRRIGEEVAKADDGIGQVDRFVNAFFDYLAEHPNEVTNYLDNRPTEASLIDTAMGMNLEALRSRLFEMMEESIQRGNKDGSVSCDDPVAASRGVFASLYGAAWLNLYNKTDLAAVRREVRAMTAARLARNGKA